MLELDPMNPSQHFLDSLRTVNIGIGLIGCLVLLFALAIPRWKKWNPSTRLGWMSLFLLVFTGTYGTFEITYLDTYFRVPMVTVALLWAIIAAVHPFYDSWKQSKSKKLR